MAGRDDDPGQLRQRLLQQRHRLVVEMVGRLVEEHTLGPAGQQGGERQAAALATGQGGDRAVPLAGELTQAEAVGDDRGPPVGVPGVVPGRPGQRGVVVLCGTRAGQVIGRVIGRVCGQRTGQALEAGDGVVQGCQRLVEDVTHRRGLCEPWLLGEVAEVARPADRARVGIVHSGQHPHQRGLAGAVLADQTERHAGRGGQVHAVEDQAVAVPLDEVAGDEGGQGSRHEGTPIARGGCSPGAGASDASGTGVRST